MNAKEPHLAIRLAMVAIAASFFVAPLYVDAKAGLRIQPVKVSHTIDKGGSVSGTISLSNVGDEDLRIEVKVEDFVPTAGSRGVQFVGRAPGLTTAIDWITLGSGTTSFELLKDATIEIPYTIQAPLDAEPGSHFGVAFFKGTKLQGAEDEQLKVGTQVGMLMLITVPGNHLQKGRILDFTGPRFVQKGPVDFKIKFENTGTVHFEPKGKIILRNIFGRQVGEVPVEGNVVLPTGAEELTASWNVKGLLLGIYTANVEIYDGEGELLTTHALKFYALPVFYMLGFLVAVILLFFILRFIKRRVRISVTLKDDTS